VPPVEKAIIDSGVILLKYWLEVSPEEQTRRLKSRFEDGRKVWKLSPMDLKSYNRWYDYSRARDDMFQATDTNFAPWRVAPSNRKKTVRLNIINDILKSIPYKELPREKLKLPARQKPGGYVEPNYPYKVIAKATEPVMATTTAPLPGIAARDIALRDGGTVHLRAVSPAGRGRGPAGPSSG
jgi:hypothetical protein